MESPSSPKRHNPTRDRIMSAAAAVLTKKGYADTRLVDIAEVAQLRAPALYYYFKSRDELVSEVMVTGQRWLRTRLTETLADLPADTSALDRICAAVEAHLRVELELSDFAMAVTRNRGQLPPSIGGPLMAESREYHAIWRSLLQAGQEDGSVNPQLEAAVARMLIIGALNWAAEWWNALHGSADEVIQTAQSIVRHGLAA